MGKTFEIAWSGWTHTGKVRSRNEDAFLALALNSQELFYLGKTGSSPLEGLEFVFAVSDGMGGEKGGAFASKLVVDTISQWLPQQRLQRPNAAVKDLLAELFATIHARLNFYGRSYEECKSMGATLTIVWITSGKLHYGHVGDSRLYRLRTAAQLEQVSNDDTHVGWLRSKGELNERQARMHPAKNRLIKVMGNGLQMLEPQLGSCDLAPGDQWLLCSDGVMDGLWDAAIQRILSGEEIPKNTENLSKAEQLVHAAIQESGKDNVTAVQICLPTRT